MELKVFWLQLAEDKLDDIYRYYRIKAGKRTAKKIVNGIADITIGLAKQPEMVQVEISGFMLGLKINPALNHFLK